MKIAMKGQYLTKEKLGLQVGKLGLETNQEDGQRTIYNGEDTKKRPVREGGLRSAVGG